MALFEKVIMSVLAVALAVAVVAYASVMGALAYHVWIS